MEVGTLGGARSGCLPTLKPTKWQSLKKDPSVGWRAQCWSCVFPRLWPQSCFNHRGRRGWRAPKHLHVTRNAKSRVRLRSHHGISPGDGWPFLNHQHLATSGASGWCPEHFWHMWAPRELPLSSPYPKISVRSCLCPTTICLFSWGICSRAWNFHLNFLLICSCLHVGRLLVEIQGQATIWP